MDIFLFKVILSVFTFHWAALPGHKHETKIRASVGKQTKEKLNMSYFCMVLCMEPSLTAPTNVIVSRPTNYGAAFQFQAPKTLTCCGMNAKAAVAENVLSDLALTKELEHLKKRHL